MNGAVASETIQIGVDLSARRTPRGASVQGKGLDQGWINELCLKLRSQAKAATLA